MNDFFRDGIEFLGRLHPMLVHLPIGFLIMLALLELLGGHSKLKHATTSNRIIFALAIPVTVFSAGCGWLLAWNGDYETQMLFWHRWTGTALVPVGFLMWWLHWRDHLKAYRVCLAATVVLLAVAGHFGASLTHGSDYLFPWRTADGSNSSGSYAKQFTYAELMEQPVYSAIVQPILKQNCVNCHGPVKSKAELKMDSATHLFAGSENGPVVVPGDSAQSELIKRVLLPMDVDDHMPPEGKRQPDFNDIALLQWWVDAGASTNKTVAELHPPENIVRVLQSKGKGAAAQ